MEGTRKLLVGKIQQVVTNLGGGEEGEQGWGPQPGESVGDFFLKQLHYLLHLLAAFWAFLVDKFNQVLPPETRDDTFHKWAHIGLTRVLPIGLVLLVFYWCCCRCRFRCRFRCCCCCCCSRSHRQDDDGRRQDDDGRRQDDDGRMMRAPGRNGALMPRASFEDDPRGYFLNLHAKKDLLY